MQISKTWWLVLAGGLAGAVNGLLGTGGGMVLIPLLTAFSLVEYDAVFSTSLAIIFPICLVSIFLTAKYAEIPWHTALPYLAGSASGGFLAGVFGRRIPSLWLHRGFGLLILYGGIHYLC